MYVRLRSAPAADAQPELDAFTKAYVEAALWSTNDESDDAGGEPLDANYSVEHIQPETLSRMIADCQRFQQFYGDVITEGVYVGRCDYPVEEMAGHDFWLTRRGCGAGFLDGDWNEDAGAVLDKGAVAFREFDLYVGDDGFIHGDGGNPEPERVAVADGGEPCS